MRWRLNLYFILAFFLSPLVWGLMLLLSGLLNHDYVFKMIFQFKVFAFITIYTLGALYWLNYVVIPAVEDNKNIEKSRKIVYLFPVYFLIILAVYPFIGSILAITGMPEKNIIISAVLVIFALLESFCISLPFYLLSIYLIEGAFGEKAFQGGSKNFPISLRIGSGLVGLVISTLLSVGILHIGKLTKLANQYGIPQEEIFASTRSCIALLTVLISVAVFFIVVVMTSISKALSALEKELYKGVEKEADLTVRLPVKAFDESGKVAYFFNLWLEKLSKIVKSILKSGKELSEHSQILKKACGISDEISTQVAKAVMEISNGAENQAKNLDELNKNIQNITKTVQFLESEVDKIHQQAVDSEKVANQGKINVNNAMEKIERLGKIIDLVTDSVSETAKAAQSIGKVSKVIEEISENTKLLSLNAAIEAAKAGDEGRGFAVVAEEIRKLANSSFSSTEEIANLVASVQEKVDVVQEKVEEGKKEFAESINAFSISEQSFTEMYEGANRTSSAVENIFSQLQQLVSYIEEEAARVEEMAAIAQETAAFSEEGAASMERLVESAQEVHKMSERLDQLSQDIQKRMETFYI